MPAVVGMALVALGRARGVEAHRFYGNALMLPFFLAALRGSLGNVQFRRRVGAVALDASKADVLLATFGWCVICLTAMVAVEWAASRAGILGRAPSDWMDSAGMVLALSLLFSIVAMLAKSEAR